MFVENLINYKVGYVVYFGDMSINSILPDTLFSQMIADSICLTTMGVLDIGGHAVRGSSQSPCPIQSVMVCMCVCGGGGGEGDRSEGGDSISTRVV